MDFKKTTTVFVFLFLWLGPYIFGMKYYNKTRTIEQKVTDRETLQALKEQNELLKEILATLQRKEKWIKLSQVEGFSFAFILPKLVPY